MRTTVMIVNLFFFERNYGRGRGILLGVVFRRSAVRSVVYPASSRSPKHTGSNKVGGTWQCILMFYGYVGASKHVEHHTV